jgi:hypothetical protein
MQTLAFHQVDQIIGHVPHGSGHEVATTTLVILWLRRLFFVVLSISRLCDGQVIQLHWPQPLHMSVHPLVAPKYLR